MPSSKKKALVVDDEESLREIIAEVLEMMDIDVILAEDGTQAVEKVESANNDIDFFLIDLFMPNMSGAETYKKLNEILPGRPVIFMSGFNEDTAPPPTGTQRFLKKPFTITQIKELITSLQ